MSENAAPARGRVTRLPPRHEEEARAAKLREVELIAWLLDNSIPVPGTGWRVGLDAIVGLIPGVGDILTGLAGIVVVVRGAALGVPRIVVARMLLNLGLDLVVGAVPVLGDLFDLGFKANARNVALMRRHVAEPGASTRGSWAFILATLAVAIVVVGAAIWLAVTVLGWLIGAL